MALGAGLRIWFMLRDHRPGLVLGGDGVAYHLEALRFAEGHAYTSSLVDIGAPNAHHPPAWVTVLGIESWVGGRSVRAHQLLTLVIGLAVIVVVGLVGRRAFGPRVGVIAAFLAALYPGFWVLENDVLSEPLMLLMMGFFVLALMALHDRPSIQRAALVGALCGLLALARSEEAALLLLVVFPILWRARTIGRRQRLIAASAAGLAMVVVIAPWALYNETRFHKTVLLSTNDGGTLLDGNCPPSTYSGALLGFIDTSCNQAVAFGHRRGLDRSDIDVLARRQAVKNMRANIAKLPATMLARIGRMFAVFRPHSTVQWVAAWLNTRDDQWPVWAWVVSFGILSLLAAVGVIVARHARALLLMLLAPAIICVFIVSLAYGEPRYHTPADFGVVVLAAVGIDSMIRHLVARSSS